jgi:hypothetical protein
MTSVVELMEQKARTIQEHRWFTPSDELDNQPRVGWLIKNVLPKKGLCVMWGAPGSGKSFAMLDIACNVALESPKYHGKRMKGGIVLYYAMEGNLTERIKAYKISNRVQSIPNLYVKHRTINFRDEYEILAEVEAIKVQLGNQKIAMVVIDTLNRSMVGGNENSSEDMSSVIAGYKMFEDAFQCLVVAIHHCGKDQDRGMRGHSSLLGAVDAELSIKRANDDPVRTLHVGKQKEGDDYYDLFNFKLEQVFLGNTIAWDPDADEDEVDTSCVIVKTNEKPSEARERTRKNQTIFDAAMQTILDRTGERSREDVRAEYYARHPAENVETKRKAFNRDWERWMNVTMKAVNSEN